MTSDERTAIRYDESNQPRIGVIHSSSGIWTVIFDEERRVRSIIDAKDGRMTYVYDKPFYEGLPPPVRAVINICGLVIVDSLDTAPPPVRVGAVEDAADSLGLVEWYNALDSKELRLALEQMIERIFWVEHDVPRDLDDLVDDVLWLLRRDLRRNKEVRRGLADTPIRLTAWLRGVLKNLCLEAARAERRAHRNGVTNLELETIKPSPDPTSPLQRRIDLEDALAKLDARQRIAIVLRDRRLSHAEIAQEMNLTIDQVRYALLTGLDALQRLLHARE
ncbi:MAG: sigma-70 family RNA polymerase sigma factor [Pirellulales bacterium]